MCGYIFSPLTPEAMKAAQKPQRKSNLWLALIPAFLTLAVATGFVAYSGAQFHKVSAAIVPGGSAGNGDPLDCVETYGFSLHTSEYYVREGIGAFTRPKNAPRELSTVLRGMARNNCKKPLTNVKIRIKVRDDAGSTGAAWADIGSIGAGQSLPFERAWMGRVTKYEIAEIR